MVFNIVLPDDLVKKADNLAKLEQKNRSEFIREAMVWYLREENNFKKVFTLCQRAMKQLNIDSEADMDKFIERLKNVT